MVIVSFFSLVRITLIELLDIFSLHASRHFRKYSAKNGPFSAARDISKKLQQEKFITEKLFEQKSHVTSCYLDKIRLVLISRAISLNAAIVIIAEEKNFVKAEGCMRFQEKKKSTKQESVKHGCKLRRIIMICLRNEFTLDNIDESAFQVYDQHVGRPESQYFRTRLTPKRIIKTIIYFANFSKRGSYSRFSTRNPLIWGNFFENLNNMQAIGRIRGTEMKCWPSCIVLLLKVALRESLLFTEMDEMCQCQTSCIVLFLKKYMKSLKKHNMAHRENPYRH